MGLAGLNGLEGRPGKFIETTFSYNFFQIALNSFLFLFRSRWRWRTSRFSRHIFGAKLFFINFFFHSGADGAAGLDGGPGKHFLSIS